MRKLSDAAKKRKAEYDTRYAADNVTRKSIYFNRNDPEDMEMVDHLNKKGARKISSYVKGLIRKDMKNPGE